MNVGHVSGGTGAGSKRPLAERHRPSWRCDCVLVYKLDGDLEGTTIDAPNLNPGWLLNCPHCWMRRPT